MPILLIALEVFSDDQTQSANSRRAPSPPNLVTTNSTESVLSAMSESKPSRTSPRLSAKLPEERDVQGATGMEFQNLMIGTRRSSRSPAERFPKNQPVPQLQGRPRKSRREEKLQQADSLDDMLDSNISSPEPWDPNLDGDYERVLDLQVKNTDSTKLSPSVRRTRASLGLGSLAEDKEQKVPIFTVPKDRRTTRRGAQTLNNDYCDSCRQQGNFICCEGCPRSFHLYCAEPPVDIDQLKNMDHWYCKECKADKFPPPYKQINGPFKQLIQNMDKTNPFAFTLPEEIKTYFQHVACNPSTGDFVDTQDLKKTRSDHDFFKLTTDDGEFIKCHKCGCSALNGPIIQCDFCPLYWHLDCLDPPMAAPPSGRKRWRCPTHADDLITKKRKVAKDQHIVVLNDPLVKNEGDVEVVLEPGFPEEPFDRSRRITYRLPEQAIKLAFMKKVGKTNVQEDNSVAAPKHLLKHYSGRSRLNASDTSVSVSIPDEIKAFYKKDDQTRSRGSQDGSIQISDVEAILSLMLLANKP